MYNMRFAPSPTGFLHLGNARTAIFCYLLAKHYNGKFFLRIEDTDLQRSKTEYTDILMKSLKFLGLNWDNEKIVYQSQRFDFYRKIADELVAKGYAYKCYLTAEEAQELKIEGKAFRSPYRNSSEVDSHECKDLSNKPYVVRFKVLDGVSKFHDEVCGDVTVNHDDIEDFVLIRSDDAPTFTLCVVADDADMCINYVLRGADHLINTVKQIMIFEAMGWSVPKYAHIPLILDSAGKKLSKRDGDIGVLDYAKKGVLPQAIVNCLMRLGWGYKNEEFIPIDKAIEIFDEHGFSKSAARFDEAKLMDLSGKYLRYLPTEEIYNAAKNYYFEYMHTDHNVHGNICSKHTIEINSNATIYSDNMEIKWNEIAIGQTGWHRFKLGMSELVTRAKTLADLFELGKPLLLDIRYSSADKFVYKTELELFFQNTNKYWRDTAEELDKSFRVYCEEYGLQFGEMAKNLRARLSNAKVSPGLFVMMHVFGPEECLQRLK